MTMSLRACATALAVLAVASPAVASGVYINGVYAPSGTSVTVPADGQIAITGGVAPHHATQHHGGYQTIDGTVAHGGNVVYAQPATAPVTGPAVHAGGWKTSRVYIAPRAGLAFGDDTQFAVRNLNNGNPIGITNRYEDLGLTGSIAAGYEFRPAPGALGWRAEIEGGYQGQDVESHYIEGVGDVTGDEALGKTKVLYGFLNLYGDLPVGQGVALTAGGGVGVGHVSFDGHGTRANGIALDDSATAFGYHLDAGMSIDIAPDVALEALYRYQSFTGAEFTTENGNDTEVDVNSHNFLAGVRVGF